MTAQEALSNLNRLQNQLQTASQRTGNLAEVVSLQQQIIAILIGLLKDPAMAAQFQQLRLQEEMQRMSLLTAMISNVMKSRHDMMKNAIANMR